jgi:hypothetical protein
VHPFETSSLSSSSSTIFDATDGVRQDPITFLDTNITHEWYFRVREDFNPLATANFLGAVVIGEMASRHGLLPAVHAVEKIWRTFEQISLPRKDHRPGENCVSWAKEAVVRLQREGIVEERPGGVDGIEAIWEVGVMLGEKIIREGLLAPGDEEARFMRLARPTTTMKHEGNVLDRVKGLFVESSTADDRQKAETSDSKHV